MRQGEGFSGLLERGDLTTVGNYMRVSHNGDRRWTFSSGDKQRRFRVRTDKAFINRLALA
jgi:hypothetical protein